MCSRSFHVKNYNMWKLHNEFKQLWKHKTQQNSENVFNNFAKSETYWNKLCWNYALCVLIQAQGLGIWKSFSYIRAIILALLLAHWVSDIIHGKLTRNNTSVIITDTNISNKVLLKIILSLEKYAQFIKLCINIRRSRARKTVEYHSALLFLSAVSAAASTSQQDYQPHPANDYYK